MPAETTGVEKPAETLIAGKYKNEEELDKGILEAIKLQHKDVPAKVEFYKTLEAGIGKPAEVPAADPSVKPLEAEVKPAELKIEEGAPTEIQPVDFQKYTADYTKNNGQLSPESYAEIQSKYNVDKATADMWIEGQQALSTIHSNKVFERAGGQAKYTEMIQWANQNLSQEDQAQFNSVIDNRDPTKWGSAVDALITQYTRANGSAPRNILGEQGAQGGLSGFGSRAEMTAAINDPRYAKDEAYRKMVATRISRMT
jgi:hypothetical protein